MQKKIFRKMAMVLAALMVITNLSPLTIESVAKDMVTTESGYATTYAISELTNVGGYGYTATANEGTTDFAFEKQYQEARFAIPAEVLNAGLTGFKANVTSTNGGWLALKAQDAAFAELAVDYGNNSLAVSNENAKNIALMSTFEGEQTISVSSITFYTVNATVEEAAPSDPETPQTEVKEKTYSFADK